MEEIFKKYPLLKDQNVPRETLIEFELFISMLQQGNDEINIISKATAKTAVSYKHLRANETKANIVCRHLHEKK